MLLLMLLLVLLLRHRLGRRGRARALREGPAGRDQYGLAARAGVCHLLLDATSQRCIFQFMVPRPRVA